MWFVLSKQTGCRQSFRQLCIATSPLAPAPIIAILLTISAKVLFLKYKIKQHSTCHVRLVLHTFEQNEQLVAYSLSPR